jgi:effector-binding domain-containing protein
VLTLPEIIDRAAQPYAFMTFTVRMDQMTEPGDRGFPAVMAHLTAQGIEPVGAFFYNYRRINMAETLEVEAGVPVARAGQDGESVRFGMLPAGRFATLSWTGHYDKLEAATAMLIGWTRQVGVDLDVEGKADGDHFACRLEIYETDPGEVPDPKDWLTTLAFKLRDQ